MMKRLADLIIDNRVVCLAIMILLTLFFLYMALTRLTVKTIFTDLLPTNHAYVKLHNEVRDKFGGANQIIIMVQVRDKEDGGQYTDVFNTETLTIVKGITDDLLKFNAVDRYKIMSLAHRKNMNFVTNASGYTVMPVMFPDVPRTPEGLKNLKDTVYGIPWNYPALVSLDSRSTVIMADFYEEQIDYKVCFKELQALRAKYENKNNIVAISGEPMHLGYIDYYVKDVLKILAYTILAMMVVFLIYFRSKRGMLLPIVAAFMSAIWGLGFLSLLRYNLDPLVLVFPFLISAMAASHSVQVVKRYKEEAYLIGDNIKACKSVVASLLVPGFAGIITDASGIFVIAFTPIPILSKICLSCAFWAVATIAVAMVTIPILLSYMPIKTAKEGEGFLDKVLHASGRWIVGWGKYAILGTCVILFIWTSFYFTDVTIGNAMPGSEILWPWHRYNVDSFRITFANPQLNPLYIVLQGDEDAVVAQPEVLRDVWKFIKFMKDTPDMRVMMVMSVLGQIPGRNRAVRDNNPDWIMLPNDDVQLKMLWRQVLFQAPPGSYDKYIDEPETAMNMVILCRDKTAETIRLVMARVNEFIRDHAKFGVRQSDVQRHGFDKFVYWVDGFFRQQERPIPAKPAIEGITPVYYRLAAGSVGVQAGINEALVLYSVWTLVMSLLAVFFFCTISYQSVVAGLVNVLPLIFTNTLGNWFMAMNSKTLALTTATLPVSSVAIGLGVDYGIYLISRIQDEYKNGYSVEESICRALGTTGKAIVYIATTIVCGIVFWFLSKMMFQAVMGLLLGVLLMLNMLSSLFVIPSILAIFKPKFVFPSRKKA